MSDKPHGSMAKFLDGHDVLLVGCGKMGMDYASVLAKLQVPYIAIGRSAAGVKKFQESTGHEAISGGLEFFLSQHPVPARAVVVILCVTISQTPSVVDLLLASNRSGQITISGMLLEKPLAVDYTQALEVVAKVSESHVTAYVAFNRRFYPAVQRLKEIIERDGGVEYVHFEFNEWEERFDKAVSACLLSPVEASNWEFVTNCHVIDMAFYLAGGAPQNVSCLSTTGNLQPIEYHPKAVAYGGSASTTHGTLITWKAYYRLKAPWMVEVVTSKKIKYQLNPIETLLQLDGAQAEVVVGSQHDPGGLRPGLEPLVQEFLCTLAQPGAQTNSGLVTLSEFELMLQRVYAKFANQPRDAVVMVGGGQIAHRYIQGFLSSGLQFPFIYVTDPSASARAALLSKLEFENPLSASYVTCVQQPTKWILPPHPKLLVSATTARDRFASTVSTLHVLEDVDCVLLEKPTFQRLEHWDSFLELVESKGINAYSSLSSNLAFSNLFTCMLKWKQSHVDGFITVEVTGIAWGLCCNAAHWIAHFVLLNGFTEGLEMGLSGFKLESNLQDKIVPSKREGCFEIASGTIRLVHVPTGQVVVQMVCSEGLQKLDPGGWYTMQYKGHGLAGYYRWGEEAAVLVIDDQVQSVVVDTKHMSQAASSLIKEVQSGRVHSWLTLQAAGTFERPLLTMFRDHFEQCGVDTSGGVPIS